MIDREGGLKLGDKLRNKVAIVTGSGQGIGRAIALALAKESAKIVTNNRWAGTSGGDAGDISSFEVACELIQTAVDKFGRLDILVNNAGATILPKVWDMTEEDWDRCIDSFLKGSFNCTRHACGIMRISYYGE